MNKWSEDNSAQSPNLIGTNTPFVEIHTEFYFNIVNNPTGKHQ